MRFSPVNFSLAIFLTTFVGVLLTGFMLLVATGIFKFGEVFDQSNFVAETIAFFAEAIVLGALLGYFIPRRLNKIESEKEYARWSPGRWQLYNYLFAIINEIDGAIYSAFHMPGFGNTLNGRVIIGAKQMESYENGMPQYIERIGLYFETYSALLSPTTAEVLSLFVDRIEKAQAAAHCLQNAFEFDNRVEALHILSICEYQEYRPINYREIAYHIRKHSEDESEILPKEFRQRSLPPFSDEAIALMADTDNHTSNDTNQFDRIHLTFPLEEMDHFYSSNGTIFLEDGKVLQYPESYSEAFRLVNELSLDLANLLRSETVLKELKTIEENYREIPYENDDWNCSDYKNTRAVCVVRAMKMNAALQKRNERFGVVAKPKKKGTRVDSMNPESRTLCAELLVEPSIHDLKIPPIASERLKPSYDSRSHMHGKQLRFDSAYEV